MINTPGANPGVFSTHNGGEILKVTVKLFATFRDGRQKVMDMNLPDGATVQTVIDSLGISNAEVAILLINGRDGTFERALAEGDTVSLFPPVGGG